MGWHSDERARCVHGSSRPPHEFRCLRSRGGASQPGSRSPPKVRGARAFERRAIAEVIRVGKRVSSMGINSTTTTLSSPSFSWRFSASASTTQQHNHHHYPLGDSPPHPCFETKLCVTPGGSYLHRALYSARGKPASSRLHSDFASKSA